MSTQLYRKYPPEINHWQGKRMLNLGCGSYVYRYPNVVNVDFYGSDADVKMDLDSETPLPFPDQSFDVIIANHCLEHLRNWWKRFNDCARLLKHNGVMEIYVPGSGTDSIFGCRDHVAEINNASFFGTFGCYRSPGNAWATEHVDLPATWLKLVRTKYYMENYWWLNLWPIRYWTRAFAQKHLRNCVRERGFIFRKVTPEEYARELERTDSDTLPVSLLRANNI